MMIKGNFTSLVCKKFISVRNRVPGLVRLSWTVKEYVRDFVEHIFANACDKTIVVCDCFMKTCTFLAN